MEHESGQTRSTDPAPTRFRSRVPGRRSFLVYLVLVHALVAWLLLDRNGVSRLEKFVRKSPVHQPEYQGMVTAHVVLTGSLPHRAVVFLGDSRMRDLDVSTVVSGPVYNLSIGGDTTRGLRFRLPRYHRLDQCGLVVLGVGVNDLAHFSDEESLHEYEAILCCLRDSGVRRVAVCSVLPIDETTYEQANAAWLRGHRTTNARIVAYNGKLRDLCERYPFARFADVTAEMSDASGNLRPGLSSDGLHLAGQGNQVWGAALKRALPLTSDH